MPTSLYFKSEKTGRRYKIVGLDKERNVVILKGEQGVEFEEDADKDRIKAMGYTLEKVEEPENEDA